MSLELFPQRKSCWSCRSCNCYTSLYFYFSSFSMFIQSRISKSVVSSQTHAAEIFRILSFVTWVEFLECYDRQQTKWPWLLTNISVNTIEARNFWITCCCFFLFFFFEKLKIRKHMMSKKKKKKKIHFNIFKKVVLRCFVKNFAKTCIIKNPLQHRSF